MKFFGADPIIWRRISKKQKITKQARKLQDAQAEKLTNLQANELTDDKIAS